MISNSQFKGTLKDIMYLLMLMLLLVTQNIIDTGGL